MKKINPKKVVYYVLLTVFALTFLLSAGYILKYFIDSRQQSNFYDDLANQVTGSTVQRPTGGYVPPASRPDSNPGGNQGETEGDNPTETPGGNDTDPSQPSSSEPGGNSGGNSGGNPGGDPGTPNLPPPDTDRDMLDEYYSVYLKNKDMVGWIRVEDTVINYPVMQTPKRKDYYLNHNFEKKWSPWGAIYAREHCDVDEPSDNVTLYGHHMKDGSMFSGLDRYWYRENWEAQPYIYFDTLYEYRTYVIFATFTLTVNQPDSFSYHTLSDAITPEQFDAFIAEAKSLAMYETGITPQYGDKILTLSTCYGTDTNDRYVVMAVLIS